ncbi:hypothetical protein ZIOFF_061962 [Zingiber officinale]|uniref:Prokaryotic-type class I peptide chain release factors domain-containing protein n=1 Tax=Zingiber officinale TaxID=94328 RepID=A0A8J5F946_ZINOF|nr:hypothetical protein ZIOFF_061962 [Zingiber officinale]
MNYRAWGHRCWLISCMNNDQELMLNLLKEYHEASTGCNFDVCLLFKFARSFLNITDGFYDAHDQAQYAASYILWTLKAGRRCFDHIGCDFCKLGSSTDGKVSARLSLMKQVLKDAEERSLSAGTEQAPKVTLGHVSVSYARSGGPGGQNVNKVNTKVDMRFNVKKADWLSERIRERILQMEKNRINKDGELVISSTKTRTQKGNIEDALEKLQAIIDAASYVPPPPSEEQKKKIEKLAAIGEQKRLLNKKTLSQKKAFRRNKDSWD